MKRDQFIAALRSELKTKWQHQGRIPGVALDCAGLLVVAAEKCGHQLLDKKVYERRPDASILLQYVRENGLKMVGKHNLEVGDVLIMSYDNNPQHFAVVTEVHPAPRIIHGAAKYHQVVEHYLTKDWSDIITYVFRFEFED